MPKVKLENKTVKTSKVKKEKVSNFEDLYAKNTKELECLEPSPVVKKYKEIKAYLNLF